MRSHENALRDLAGFWAELSAHERAACLAGADALHEKQALAEALRMLLTECRAAGLADALDFGWPAAIQAAVKALKGAPMEPTR